MLRTNQMQAIVALADTGAIRGAARALGISQSAVTRTLKELETSLGTRLFERKTHGTEFSLAGQSLVAHARHVLSTLARAEDEVRRLSGRGHARARIALTPLVAAAGLSRIVQQFYQRYPDGEIDVTTGIVTSIMPLVMEGQLDFAVVFADPDRLPTDIVFEPLAEVQMVPVGNTATTFPKPAAWEHLATFRWAVNPTLGSADRAVLDWLEAKGIRLSLPPVYCRSPFMLAILGSAPDLIAFSPRPLVRMQLQARGLDEITVPDLPPPMRMGLIWRRNLPLSVAVRFTMDLVKRVRLGL